VFSPPAISRWDHLHKLGHTHVAPLGGSDDHRAGANDTAADLHSPLGSPTTLVLAANLSHAAILDGIALGRTVIKMYGPDDPMVTLQCLPDTPAPEDDGNNPVEVGGWCVGGGVLLASVSTTPVSGTFLCLLRNNAVVATVVVPSNCTEFPAWNASVAAPADGSVDRWRAELRDNAPGDPAAVVPDAPRTLTNHIFVSARAPAQPHRRRRQ
jgi:hypothetical protein